MMLYDAQCAEYTPYNYDEPGNTKHSLQHSTLRLFADDSIIYKEIKTINDAQNLQLDLDAACRWEKDWLMHFHPDKCNLISITQKHKPIHFTYN